MPKAISIILISYIKYPVKFRKPVPGVDNMSAPEVDRKLGAGSSKLEVVNN